VLELINGKMRTPKVAALHRLITFLNLNRDYNFPLLPVDTSPLESNAWFAGFAEADGSFYIRTTETPLKIAPQFVLEQRYDPGRRHLGRYPRPEAPRAPRPWGRRVLGAAGGGANKNYQGIMEAVSHYLLSNLQIAQRQGYFLPSLPPGRRTQGPTSWGRGAQGRGALGASGRVLQGSLAGNFVLISYFTSFPLFGSKRLDYFDWCQSVELVAKGNHKTTQVLASMKQLKTDMNNNRYFFYMGTPRRLL
jgi:hypothetical protein